MAISAAVIELALAFENELASGRRPSIEAFLDRSPTPADRLDLLVQLLACESGHQAWEIERLWAKVNAFPELLSEPKQVAELVRTVYRDRIAGRVSTTWDMFCRFGLSAEEMELCCENERHFLGERLLGRYELLERLGAGTFGVVFRASDRLLGEPVAIKVPHYPRKPELATSMLRREWQVVSSFEHSRVVTARALEDSPGLTFLVLEYMPGGSLLRLLAAGPLEPLAACRLTMQVAEALEPAHRAGIFHRDIKPENILLDQNGDACVSDFGFALSMDEQWDKEGEVAGTFPYMAPELLLGATHQIDGRADLWSLGMILLEMLIGRRLSLGNTREEALVASVLHGKEGPRLSDNLPEWLRPIVTRCLYLDPNERYDSVEEFRRDLQEAITVLASARSREQTTGASRNDLLSVWRLGVKIGLATLHHEAFSSYCSEIMPLFSDSTEALPRELVNKLGFAVMHEVGAVKAYDEAQKVAKAIGLILPETPQDNARSITIIYRGSRLTRADLPDFTLLIETFREALKTADDKGVEFIRRDGEKSSSFYLFAREAARMSRGHERTALGLHAERAGIPCQLYEPFREALRAATEGDEVQKAFNQMDKRIERYLTEKALNNCSE